MSEIKKEQNVVDSSNGTRRPFADRKGVIGLLVVVVLFIFGVHGTVNQFKLNEQKRQLIEEHAGIQQEWSRIFDSLVAAAGLSVDSLAVSDSVAVKKKGGNE